MTRLVLALLNLLGCPGLGTFLAGRRRAGLIQICLHFTGTALTIGGFCLALPVMWPVVNDTAALREFLQYGLPAGSGPVWPPLLVGLIGSAIFFANWLWSATTTQPAASGKTPPPLPSDRRGKAKIQTPNSK
jgi:hypothetical protein